MRKGSRLAGAPWGPLAGKFGRRSGHHEADVAPRLAHHYAQIEGACLHYVTAGEPDRDAVVLLHGWPQTWLAWRKVIPLLAREYFVIAPDLPGLGDSAAPAAGFTKRSLAQALEKLLFGELHLPSFHLVGHDWGGPIAVHIAAANPGAVRSLAVVDVTMPEHAETASPDADLRSPEAGRGEQPATLREERAYLAWYYNYHCHTPGALDDVLDTYLDCYLSPRAMWAGVAYRRVAAADVHDMDALRAGAHLKTPVLAIGGGASRGGEVAESMAALADEVRGVILEGCGRFAPEERPQDVATQLKEHFLLAPLGATERSRRAASYRAAFA